MTTAFALSVLNGLISNSNRRTNGNEETVADVGAQQQQSRRADLFPRSLSLGGHDLISQQQQRESALKKLKDLDSIENQLVLGNRFAITQNRADHAFNGILFKVEIKPDIAVEFVEIQSLSIRGELGRISIYCWNYEETFVRIFGPNFIAPSPYDFVELSLSKPIRLVPSMQTAIYIHSELQNDTAIVYSNVKSSKYTFEDDIFIIHPGIAHTSPIPFEPINQWGAPAWRRHREFIGVIKYGYRELIWNINNHLLFPFEAQNIVRVVMLCHHHLAYQQQQQHERKRTFGHLPKEVVLKILSFVEFDIGKDDNVEKHRGAVNRSRRMLKNRGGGRGILASLIRGFGEHKYIVAFLILLCVAMAVEGNMEIKALLGKWKKEWFE
jgi:hypothetical protein